LAEVLGGCEGTRAFDTKLVVPEVEVAEAGQVRRSGERT